MRNYFLGLCLLFALCFTACSHSDDSVDVLIIGGGASGVTAGIQSARMGAATLIVEETEWLGGMLTSAGVSAVDGNYDLPAGLFGEFRGHLADYYGGLDSLKTGWVSAVLFEPSVGNKIFHEMVDAEKNLKVWHNATLVKLERENDAWIAQIQMKDNTIKKIHAKILIDGTELGDIAKMCGVKYDIGMESRHDTKEDIAPEEKNNIVQDITYVAILKDYGKDVTIPCPEGYNKDEFACACASHVCITPKEPDRVWSKDMMITYGKLPNNKYMINWPIEGNDYYVNLIEMTREEREEALKYAKHYTMCFVYFLQHELGFNTLGLADDEYPTADKLPFIPYHRESRRIHGLVRFDLNHACEPFRQSQPLYRTCIAVGNYPVDHHHTRYHGYEELPNLYFHPIPSYGLPLGTLIPKDVEGLIVAEKSISVSNIINGTTRLQPMVMQIGQAAGALAALAVKEGKNIREVSVREVQNAILDGKGYLLPYLDVELDHPMFKSLQRIGSTGILKGIGKSVDWSNQMWFRADTLLKVATNLIDYSFKEYRDSERNDPASPSYGLLGWAYTHKGTYYGDDNARFLLGVIASSALLNDTEWDKKIAEGIIGNFRTTGINGFRGGSLLDTDIQKRGWKSFYDNNTVNLHAHFEAWNWACYLWLYNQTQYEPLLERSKKALSMMMASYPEQWSWTNGIQQERARMILPLAWLYRVEPTEEHLKWLHYMTNELLKNQVTCGGIREELGDESKSSFGHSPSNEAYGSTEASLIFDNGDPVADMLYTTNFAFVGLCEAAKATNDSTYVKAVNQMRDFLIRIQVKSDKFRNVDGAWFRAFNYQDWNYWAANADAGWGAWSTLTGWIQSWIVGTQFLMEKNTSLWELSNRKDISKTANKVIEEMINNNNYK